MNVFQYRKIPGRYPASSSRLERCQCAVERHGCRTLDRSAAVEPHCGARGRRLDGGTAAATRLSWHGCRTLGDSSSSRSSPPHRPTDHPAMLSLPEIEAMAATWWVQKNEVDNLNIVLRKRKYVPYELTSFISLRAALFPGGGIQYPFFCFLLYPSELSTVRRYPCRMTARRRARAMTGFLPPRQRARSMPQTFFSRDHLRVRVRRSCAAS
jgi:hypothetical protein